MTVTVRFSPRQIVMVRMALLRMASDGPLPEDHTDAARHALDRIDRAMVKHSLLPSSARPPRRADLLRARQQAAA